MKKIFIYSIATITFFAGVKANLSAQEQGKITYETIVQYDFESVSDSPRWTNYIADLPKSGVSIQSLNFDEASALFSEEVNHNESAGPNLNRAMGALNANKGPQVESLEIFYDFDKNKKIEQVEFMTRLFIIESELESVAWKITGKQKKVMDYVCMGAELQEGEDTITAWFSSEIPISAGPGKYRGLPGVILGIEKNDVVVSLATSIDFENSDKSAIKKPKEGKKVSQKEFDIIVAEKLEEFKKSGKATTDKRG
jgi:GLPGLI family protein